MRVSQQTIRLSAALLVLTLMTAGCARNKPPLLSPAAATAWQQHEIQKDLDLVRDLAIDANAQVPPLVSTATTRKVVTYHRTAITLVHDAPAGWKLLALKGADELQRDIPAAEYQHLAVYVELVKTVLKELP